MTLEFGIIFVLAGEECVVEQGRKLDFRPLAIGIPVLLFVLAACYPAYDKFPDLLHYLNIVIPPEVSGLIAAVALGFCLNSLFAEMWKTHRNSRRNIREIIKDGEIVECYEPQQLWSLRADRPFYDQRLFNWSIRIPLYTIGVVLLLTVSSEDSPFSRDWRFDHIGFLEFLSIYQFPLYILSVMGVLGVMVARFHASKYNDVMLKVTEAKNDFDRRFKHQDEFENYVKKSTLSTVSIRSGAFEMHAARDFSSYHVYFPDNTNSVVDYEVSVETYEKRMLELNNLVDEMQGDLQKLVCLYIRKQDLLEVLQKTLKNLKDEFEVIVITPGSDNIDIESISINELTSWEFWYSFAVGARDAIGTIMSFMQTKEGADIKHKKYLELLDQHKLKALHGESLRSIMEYVQQHLSVE